MPKYVLDIETNTKHDHIWLCVTKNLSTGEVLCHTEASSLKRLVKATDTLIGHNLVAFDIPILNRLWNTKITLSQLEDTYLMSSLAKPHREGGHSLAAWGRRIGFPKGDFTNYDGGLCDEMVEYCKQDVEITARIYSILTEELKGFSKECQRMEHQVQAIINRQERTGFLFDRVKATALFNQLDARMKFLEQYFIDEFEPTVVEMKTKTKVIPFNPSSRQQIADRLMKRGWKPKQYTEKGAVIVNEDVLEGITIPEAQHMAEYFLLQKRISQLRQWFDACGEDQRIHGKVFTLGTITGRMSHTTPNMAQVPSVDSPFGAECRDLFTVPEDCVLVGVDASGLELRMLAHYMEDEEYINEVLHGDVHTKNMTAAGLTSRPQAKTFIYAFLYGAGDEKIGSIVGGSASKGKKLKEKFLANTPALKELKKKVASHAEKGYLALEIDGRRLWVRSPHAALNTLLQGAGAIVMKKALCILDKWLRKEKIPAKFVANVHDEWQLEVIAEHGEKVGKMAVEAIREAGKQLNLRCPMDGEYKIGKTWKDTH